MLNYQSVGMLCQAMAQALYLLTVKTMSVILLECNPVPLTPPLPHYMPMR